MILDEKGNKWAVFEDDTAYPLIKHLDKKKYRLVVLPQNWLTRGQVMPDVEAIFKEAEEYLSLAKQVDDKEWYEKGIQLLQLGECVNEAAQYFGLHE